MKISIITLGCKLNQAESDEIKKILESILFLFFLRKKNNNNNNNKSVG